MKQLTFLTLLVLCLLEISCLVNQSVQPASLSETNKEKKAQNQDNTSFTKNNTNRQKNPIEVPHPTPVEAAPLLKGKKGFTPWQYTIGDFIISWKGSTLNNAQLSISSPQDTSKIYWRSLAGKSFILVADAIGKKGQGAEKVVELMNTICGRQGVESAVLKDKILTIIGFLDCSELGNINYTLTITSPEKEQLKFDLQVNHPTIGRTGLVFESEASERIFGFGEQFSRFDFKGKRIPIFVDEQGLSRDAQPLTDWFDNYHGGIAGEWHSTYAPIPYFMTSSMRAMVLENTEYSTFDLRRPEQISTEVYANHLELRLFSGDTPLELIENYTAFSGRMRKLPDWILDGVVLGLQGGTERTLAAVEKLQQENGKIAAVWLQDWEGQRYTKRGNRLWWNWVLDENR